MPCIGSEPCLDVLDRACVQQCPSGHFHVPGVEMLAVSQIPGVVT